MKKIMFAVCGAMFVAVAPITASAATETAAVVVETKTETVTWKPMSDQSSAQKKVPVITPDKAAVKKKVSKKSQKNLPQRKNKPSS